ncbi:MAG: histidine kinase [Actinobacteria bacterium]|nr:MAG: histidine kinase [Actinomycetota bacterium]
MLAGRHLNFGEYTESELIVPTVNAIFLWNTSNPQILQLRAHWRGVAHDDAQFQILADEVARCNATRTGPKAYLAPFEDGVTYGLIAECNIVAQGGLSETQLDGFCETSMEMIMSFFHDLENNHPSLVTWEADTQ